MSYGIPKMHNKQLFAALAFSVTFAGYLIFQLATHDALNALPRDADEVYFEILSYNIARGKGFSGEIDDAVLAPYIAANTNGYYDSIISGQYRTEIELLGIDSTTTYRAPLYPALIALLYKLFGRHFVLYRLINVIALALGGGIICLLCYQLAGHKVATVAAILIFVDPFLKAWASLGLTESVEFLLIALLSWGCIATPTDNRRTHNVIMGLILGLLAIERSVFAIWLPFVFLGRFFLERALAPVTVFKHSLLVLVIALAIAGPWWLRNCLVLKSFMPLGSQGGMILGMIYNDETLEHRGNWTSEEHHDYYESFVSPARGTDRERELAIYGSSKGITWLRQHYTLIPKLILLRIQSLWWSDAMPYQRLLVIFTALGLFYTFRKPEGQVLFLFLVIHSLAIGLTCNVVGKPPLIYGRYLFSLHPIMLIFSAIAIVKTSELPSTLRR